MKKTLLILVGYAMLSISYGQTWLDDYQNILDKYATNDGVKYKKLKAKDASKINSITQVIGGHKPSGSQADKLAFYLNAYNVWMIKTVLDHYPTSSVLESDPEVFKRKNIKVAGKVMSLDDLEHGLIRKKFNEARIHFVINCASESCPPLPRTALTGENLYQKLHEQTVKFMNSKHGVTQKGDALNVSKLFEWFAKDFKKASPDGSVLGFIKQYKTVKGAPVLNYAEYSWKLNED